MMPVFLLFCQCCQLILENLCCLWSIAGPALEEQAATGVEGQAVSFDLVSTDHHLKLQE